MKLISILLLAMLPYISFAEEKSRIPTDLFGVELGSVHQLDENDAGSLPIRKLTGIQPFRTGAIVYFEPSAKYPAFPYSAFPEKGNKYFKTSFNLEMYIVIPADVEKAADIDLDTLEMQVAQIEWQVFTDDEGQEISDYFWAKEMCEMLELDLNFKPEITDYFDTTKWYQCIFTDQDRQFIVSSLTGRKYSLSFERKYKKMMDEAIKKRMRQLRMDAIRPYNLPD